MTTNQRLCDTLHITPHLSNTQGKPPMTHCELWVSQRAFGHIVVYTHAHSTLLHGSFDFALIVQIPQSRTAPCTGTKKKMIILHKGPAEHRDPGTSSPQGEPGTPPSVLTPQSPCTVERAVGVGALYRDTIYAAASGTNVTTPFCTGRGGSSLPPGRGRVLGQGRPRPPPSHARAAIALAVSNQR